MCCQRKRQGCQQKQPGHYQKRQTCRERREARREARQQAFQGSPTPAQAINEYHDSDRQSGPDSLSPPAELSRPPSYHTVVWPSYSEPESKQLAEPTTKYDSAEVISREYMEKGPEMEGSTVGSRGGERKSWLKSLFNRSI